LVGFLERICRTEPRDRVPELDQIDHLLIDLRLAFQRAPKRAKCRLQSGDEQQRQAPLGEQRLGRVNRHRCFELGLTTFAYARVSTTGRKNDATDQHDADGLLDERIAGLARFSRRSFEHHSPRL
jgi:hypothetical protein